MSHIGLNNNFDLVDITNANATLLTMESGYLETDLIRNGILTIRGGVIEYVGLSVDYLVTHWCDCDRRRRGCESDCVSVCLCILMISIIPEFIDVHALWDR